MYAYVKTASVRNCTGISEEKCEDFIKKGGIIEARDKSYYRGELRDGFYRVIDGEYKCTGTFESNRAERKYCDNCRDFENNIIKQRRQYVQKNEIGSKQRSRQITPTYNEKRNKYLEKEVKDLKVKVTKYEKKSNKRRE